MEKIGLFYNTAKTLATDIYWVLEKDALIQKYKILYFL